MPTSAAGNSRLSHASAPRLRLTRRAAAAAGFTLLELLVVLAIMAMATGAVSLALRDSSYTRLEREGQRLAALLEAARARSRVSGVPVRWRPTADGFLFDSPGQDNAPERWLSPDTQAVLAQPLVLGPEPIIGAQAVELTSLGADGVRLRLATDGVRPFAVRPVDAAAP